MTVLCWSQSDEFGEWLRRQLTPGDWEFYPVQERDEVIQVVKERLPVLVLADQVNLEDIEWCRRQVDPNCPILLFGRVGNNEDQLAEAIEKGISGLRKPVSSRLLNAKIKSLLQPSHHGRSIRHSVKRFNLVVDDQRHRVEIGGESIHLTLTEFKILKELASDQDRVVPRQEIQSRVFGVGKPTARSLDVHVCAVRKKIRKFGLDVESVRGVGYRLSSCAN